MNFIIAKPYACGISERILNVKLKYWNHEGINLHSRDIRKANGPYGFLQVPEKRKIFLSELSHLMDTMACTVFIICIDKSKHIAKYGPTAENPYEFALKMCMERNGAGRFFLKQKWTVPVITRDRPPTGNSQSIVNYNQYASLKSNICVFKFGGNNNDTPV